MTALSTGPETGGRDRAPRPGRPLLLTWLVARREIRLRARTRVFVITTAITAGQTTVSNLNTQISNWNDRLTQIQDAYTAKFTAMETALAQLQSQQSYLTSMFDSINKTSSSSSSN